MELALTCGKLSGRLWFFPSECLNPFGGDLPEAAVGNEPQLGGGDLYTAVIGGWPMGQLGDVSRMLRFFDHGSTGVLAVWFPGGHQAHRLLTLILGL